MIEEVERFNRDGTIPAPSGLIARAPQEERRQLLDPESQVDVALAAVRQKAFVTIAPQISVERCGALVRACADQRLPATLPRFLQEAGEHVFERCALEERRVRGIRNVDSRPIVRRIRERTGVGAARGIEITVTIDEKAFEGTGIFLLGAVLDRFFAEYSGFNIFTQTVIRSVERGEVARWPPRMGTRRPL